MHYYEEKGMNFVSLIMPAIMCLILIYALIRRVDVFSAFVSGASGGISIVFKVMPYVVGMVFAVDIFMGSGVFDMLSRALSGVSGSLGLPVEILPLALMRPFSGGASIGLLSSVLLRYGADSYIGAVASIYLGSTETLFYTVTLYLGSVGIKKTRYIIPAALACDALGLVLSCIFAGWMG